MPGSIHLTFFVFLSTKKSPFVHHPATVRVPSHGGLGLELDLRCHRQPHASRQMDERESGRNTWYYKHTWSYFFHVVSESITKILIIIGKAFQIDGLLSNFIKTLLFDKWEFKRQFFRKRTNYPSQFSRTSLRSMKCPSARTPYSCTTSRKRPTTRVSPPPNSASSKRRRWSKFRVRRKTRGCHVVDENTPTWLMKSYPRVQHFTRGLKLFLAFPHPPTNLRIADVSPTSVRLSWSYPGSPNEVQYYVIQYKPRLASWDYKEISGAITNFYDIRGYHTVHI